ncbi:MAG TPA: hypothetical protein DD462_08850, partial [Leeuwenhoekiella sp.]|nr:hypothetical protein [Leeuwenhoekiella sp.]
MKAIKLGLLCLFTIAVNSTANAQDASQLTLDRIYSSEFRGESARAISWIDDGDAFVTIEQTEDGQDQLIKY